MSRSVHASIQISTSPRRVIDAFLVQTDLRGWWGVERSLVQPRTGGIYALTWGVSAEGFKYISSGIIAALEPERRILIRDYLYYNPERPILGPMSLEIRVRPEGPSLLVEVTQDGYGEGTDWDWYYDAVKGAWPMALRSLKAYLEKHP